MSDDLTAQADRILEDALAASGARDPRDFYRERLRDLKQVSRQGYREAVDYYKETLIPSVARGEREPLEAWTEYGRKLAEALEPGRTVSIDRTGRAQPYASPSPEDLVLQLPKNHGARAILIGLPADLSPAQRATYDVLVSGKHRQRST